MGQDHADTKLAAMMPFQVTADLMAGAKQGAAFLHCLPAHRGEEVTAEVIDGPHSLIWSEAENRLHEQRSEERRVGKECVSPCSSRRSPYHANKTISANQPDTEVLTINT